jgi:hypothetical protein
MQRVFDVVSQKNEKGKDIPLAPHAVTAVDALEPSRLPSV